MTVRIGPRWMLVLIGVGGSVACQPELEPIRWDGVDVEALEDAIANPTGIVDEASANEVASLVISREPAYQALSDYLADVFEEAEGADARPPWVLPQALDGTSVYVLVACPGPLLDAYAEPFTQGLMRVDSPTLTEAILASEEIVGQLLLTFEGCVIDGLEFNGTAVAFREEQPEMFGMVPELSYDLVDDDDDEPFVMTEPLLWQTFDEGSALFELESTETLALDWSVLTNELQLRGSNGALVCDILQTNELMCTVP